ncbi:aminopeptidase N [Dokdonia pacifica]|uniref:Aminopeptidase N n=1 Tax=Dokdonia pacifica TaxID=1627892 RepID=A0A238WFA6_9FLAO|nr:M1 family aminopeptidase [Dokdonia pacifica]GGG20707.1 aminopeptidase N [Dokdonia pacifica]SNR45031.1 aminopeptidase N [Dokdonia pacifica]
MIKSISSLVIALLLCLSCKQTPSEVISLNDTGVPLEMATYRRSQVADVTYQLGFAIPEKKEDPITAIFDLELTIKDLTHPLYLDFKEASNALQSLVVNDKQTAIVHNKEHLIIPVEALKLGKNHIDIKFYAGELSLNRNDDYLYTLLVPDRARTVFPCFDQPDIKATYTLEISVPKEWKVLCGAPLASKNELEDFTVYQFEPSDKMSTYLFSFVAGQFEDVTSQDTKREMNMLYRETNEEKITASTDRIFELHQLSLDFLEAYTQVDFPFKKFDFATIPGFQYGGMEHTGAIQYRESSLFLDNSATRSQELSRAKLIAHETAHMWFGNLVTMEWFNDVWMKEVFANFMADKIVNPVFTDINHDLQFLTSHYPRAYSVDRTKGTNPIRQDLDNLKNAGSLYGSIIYNKAPIMMRQLELALGETKFKDGIGEYIATYANGNADWNGLVEILDTKTDLDLKQWSDVWVNSAGRPVFSGAIAYDNNNTIQQFTLSQKAEDGSDHLWPQSFDISLVYKDSITTIPVVSNKKQIEISQAVGAPEPLYVLYNSNGYGYGVFPVSEVSKTPTIQDEVARAHAYLNTYENTLNGTIVNTVAFKNLIEGIKTESNELILRMITGQASSLYWNSFTEEERIANQPDLETTIYKRLKQSESKNIKKTLFNTYRSVAHSEEGIATLYRIWNKEETIDNLVLNKDNYTSLAQRLALYGHPDAEVILTKAKSVLTNPDKIQRFEFLEPALDSDPTVRIAYFESFKDATNREKENWVQTACSFIHHPLRQKENGNSVALSLELLEEVQETGDIFFPLGWLNSTIGQYTSPKAYTLVNTYIATHPDLDPNLMRKLLQATDNLNRRHHKR